jgi:hypothetical protein
MQKRHLVGEWAKTHLTTEILLILIEFIKI